MPMKMDYMFKIVAVSRKRLEKVDQFWFRTPYCKTKYVLMKTKIRAKCLPLAILLPREDDNDVLFPYEQ